MRKDTGAISDSHVSQASGHITEHPFALEISFPLRIWLTQRASALGAVRPISQNQLQPAISPLYPETAIVIECLS